MKLSLPKDSKTLRQKGQLPILTHKCLIQDSLRIMLIFKHTPPSALNEMLEQELGKLSPVSTNFKRQATCFDAYGF